MPLHPCRAARSRRKIYRTEAETQRTWKDLYAAIEELRREGKRRIRLKVKLSGTEKLVNVCPEM